MRLIPKVPEGGFIPYGLSYAFQRLPHSDMTYCVIFLCTPRRIFKAMLRPRFGLKTWSNRPAVPF